MQSPSPVLTIRGPDDTINCLKCLDGSIATGSICGNLHIWDLSTKRLTSSISQAHRQSILSLIQVNDNKKLISSSRDGDVKVWDIENLQSPSALATFVTGAFHFCNISGDRSNDDNNSSSSVGCLDKYGIVTPSNELSEVIMWDLRTSSRSSSFHLPSSCGMTTHLLYYSNLASTFPSVFVGSEDGSVSIFDLRNTRCNSQSYI